MRLQRQQYSSLSPRQKEAHNFQKISALLADFGYSTTRLWDDTNGVDFVALHADGKTLYKIQLKGRVVFNKKYKGKDLWIAFRAEDAVYVFPHDKVLKKVLSTRKIMYGTTSWKDKGEYSFKTLSAWLRPLIKEYEICKPSD